MEYRVLIVEDEPKLCEVLCDYFRSRGDLPTPAPDGEAALAQAEGGQFDAVLLDVMMHARAGRLFRVPGPSAGKRRAGDFSHRPL